MQRKVREINFKAFTLKFWSFLTDVFEEEYTKCKDLKYQKYKIKSFGRIGLVSTNISLFKIKFFVLSIVLIFTLFIVTDIPLKVC